MAFGKGIAHNNGTDFWDINDDGGSPIAAFSHVVFHTIANAAPVCFALPLDSSGLSPNVWLQSAATDLVKLATPSKGLTPLAQERLENRIHRALMQKSTNASLHLERLRDRLRDIRADAEKTPAKRLNARSL